MKERDLDVLVVDHYDSFTYNLVADLSRAQNEESDPYIRGEPDVMYHDSIDLEGIKDKGYDAIVLSPGPGHPENDKDLGVTSDILEELTPETPTFGVCLGLEAGVHVYGGMVGKAPEEVHGESYPIEHDGEGIFEGLDDSFGGGRYHSLAATEVPECLEVTATTEQDGEDIVMGVRHKNYPFEAVQFHPESVLTSGKGHRYGIEIAENFLQTAENYIENPEAKKDRELI